MKKRYLMLLLLSLSYSINLTAQSFAINTDGSTANASALLDVKSTAKGILIPRMSRTERDAITLPATGLLIFQTGPDSLGLYYYSGSKWTWMFSNANSDSLAWRTGGNAGTTTTKFIGTTDNVPFNIRVNGQPSGEIDHLLNNTFFGYQSGMTNTTGYSNTANGFKALSSNTTGWGNVAIGDSALRLNTTGSFNVANGYKALSSNSIGYGNIAEGFQPLYSNTVGIHNIAMGFQALYLNTSGDYNLAMSVGALFGNTTGDFNTAIGSNALSGNVAGSYGTAVGLNAMINSNSTATPFTNYNVALGYEALRGSNLAANNTGNYNVALGFQSLWSNSSGFGNTATGVKTLYSNTTGDNNTATGDSALYSNTTGSNNTSMGYQSLWSNTSGINNTAAGLSALNTNTSGGNNTAYGWQALFSNVAGSNATAVGALAMANSNNTASPFINFNAAFGYSALKGSGTVSANTGNQNTAIGSYALSSNSGGGLNTATGKEALFSNTMGNSNTANGIEALALNTSGDGNTALGQSALFANTTGDNNTALGNSANVGSGNLVNATAIGNGAIVNASNAIQLGNASVSHIYAGIGNTGTIHAGYGIMKNDLRIDDNDANDGDTSNTLRFGAYYTGETIGSKRTLGGNHWGLDFITNYVNRMVITNAGNVGIGVYSPARKLSVATDIGVDESNTNNGTLSGALHFGASNSGEAIASNRYSGNLWGLDFYTNNLNRLSIANSGNVGIGTVAPSATLDVNGTTTTNGLQVSNGTVFVKMQHGSIVAGSNGTGEKQWTIAFPVAFATSTPHVFLTARNDAGCSSCTDAFSVSVRAVSAVAVYINIQRTDTNSGWGQQLIIDWFAVE